MLENESPTTVSNPIRFDLKILLTILIAALSIVTGYAAFQSAAIDSTSADNYFLAQTYLTDASLLYIEQGQEILYDRNAYDYYLVNKEANEAAAEYYFEQLSDQAQESLDRPDGPFDQAYYKAMYTEARDLVEKEEAIFDSAAHDSNRAVAYQLTVLIMAVGLAFAAWASLVEEQNMIRFVFTALSILALIVGLVQMLSIPGPLGL